MKKINIYVDMDGVQAGYGFGDSVEEMAEPGYFRNRPVYENMMRALRMLQEDDRFRVVILSAVFRDGHSIRDKQDWLQAQGFSDIETCFVPLGEKKSDYARPEGIAILIDDFSRNLFEWERSGENFYGIKFLNEGNGSRGTWNEAGGFTVSYRMSGEKLYYAISGIACALERAA